VSLVEFNSPRPTSQRNAMRWFGCVFIVPAKSWTYRTSCSLARLDIYAIGVTVPAPLHCPGGLAHVLRLTRLTSAIELDPSQETTGVADPET